MAPYRYRALQPSGTMMEGTLEAPSRQDACRQLDSRGLIAVKVECDAVAKAQPAAPFVFPFHLGRRERISHAMLQEFTHQLSSLLSAGVSLSRALQVLSNEAASPAAQATWKGLRDLVIDGWSFADAMARFPRVFSSVYMAMVRAGEAGGFLDVVLEEIAELQARERELKSRVMSALIYPIVLLVLACGVLTFLLVFFIPRFQTVFETFDAALPMITQVIVNASKVMQRYGLFVLALLIIGVVSAHRWLQTEAGRRTLDRWLLRLPLFGPLKARFAMTRFCRMFGTLVGAGVPLVNSLLVARQSIGSQVLTDTLNTTVEGVQKGESLASSLRACPELFPGSVLEMVSVAEETGRIDKEFVRVATAAEKELDRRLRTTVALAEPLVLFVIAGIIGLVFIGMVLPIFTLQEHIK